MVSLYYIMEPKLESQPQYEDDLLNAASYFACDAQAQCIDVSVMAFPVGHKSPTDEMLSAVTVKLRNLILGIEAAIVLSSIPSVASMPESWNILLKSDFLREPMLIDFILAQFASERLSQRILDNSNTRLMDQLPARLLSGNNLVLADAAQALLASEMLMRRSPELIYHQVSSELLHQTTWRIVAALQIQSGEKNEQHINNSKRLLSNHDEGNSVHASARKIVHFLHGEAANVTLDPAQSGLAVFAASLAAHTGLDHDHVLRLIDGHSSAPLAMMLRASGIGRESAMEAICLFKGFNLTPLEISYVDRHYEVLAPDQAKSAIALWHADRARYLAFPELDKSA